MSTTTNIHEKAYDSVRLREVWGLISLGLLVLSLTTQFAVRLLPEDLPNWGPVTHRPVLAFLAVPVVSLLGIGCALLAGRQHTATGRIGFFLNLTVFCLSTALIALAASYFALR